MAARAAFDHIKNPTSIKTKDVGYILFESCNYSTMNKKSSQSIFMLILAKKIDTKSRKKILYTLNNEQAVQNSHVIHRKNKLSTLT